MQLSVHEIDSPLGRLLLATGARGEVRGLDFCVTRLGRRLRQQYREHTLIDAAAPSAVVAKLLRYFAGQLGALDDIEVDTSATGLQRQVWGALRQIPAGEVTSYGQLARRLGYSDPRAAREVGAANATNPIAIIVPCHRVVGAGGDLKGYAWGLERKRWLLAHEGVDLGGRPALRLPGL